MLSLCFFMTKKSKDLLSIFFEPLTFRAFCLATRSTFYIQVLMNNFKAKRAVHQICDNT